MDIVIQILDIVKNWRPALAIAVAVVLCRSVLDGGAPLATRGLCATRGVWRSYQTKFEIGIVELLARKKELATAPGTTNTRLLGGRTEIPEFGVPSKSQTSRFRAVTHQVFYVKSAQSRYRYKTSHKANPLPENQDATSFSGGRGKTRDGLLSSARINRSGRPSHRGWCGTMVRACSETRQPVRRPNLRPQVRPLAPCFTVRSPGRNMPPDIRPMCHGAPDFRSCSLIADALESRRVH